MAEEWITTQEAAELIGVTDAHVRYLLDKDRMKSLQVLEFDETLGSAFAVMAHPRYTMSKGNPE